MSTAHRTDNKQATQDVKMADSVVDDVSSEKRDLDNRLLDGEGHIFLIPTPTEDPADPLNWHPFRKAVVLGLLILWSSAALSIQAFLLNYIPSLEERFPEANAYQINMLITLLMVMIAPGQLFFTPLAIAYGRRLSMLLATALLLASSLWGAYSGSYGSLLAARIFEGLAAGPTDCMVYVIVSEFTFIHERGTMLGIVMAGQMILQLGLSIATNYMAITIGFKTPFLMFAGVAAATLVGFFFFLPETRYLRDENYDLPRVRLDEFPAFRRRVAAGVSGQYEPFTVKKQLKPWASKISGSDTNSVRWFFKRMGKHSLSPIMWWTVGINTIMCGSLLAASTYYAIMLVSPPWSWAPQNVGLINLGPAVAAAVNWVILGWGNDKILVWLAKRNNNVTKQEHRLVVVIIPIVTGFIATIAFGVLAQNYMITNPGGAQPHWFSIVFIISLYYESFCGITAVTLTYLANTTSPEDSLAVMTLVSVLRDGISFGMSYGVVGFSNRDGFLTSFGIYALLTGIFGFLLFPVYKYADWVRERLGLQVKTA